MHAKTSEATGQVNEAYDFTGIPFRQFLTADVLLLDLFAAIQGVEVRPGTFVVVALNAEVLIKACVDRMRTVDSHSQVPLTCHLPTIREP